MVEEHAELAAYFDRWYADMAGAPIKDAIQQRHLGLPAELLSTSLLSWTGIADVAEALALAPGDPLVDLACGRGGYGLELASRTGARVLGVDFTPSAPEAARRQAVARGIDADYRVGDLVATGLAGGLRRAGYVDIRVRERADWRDAERAMWREAAALDPGDDAALVSFHQKGVRVLEGFDRVRRVIATAARPS